MFDPITAALIASSPPLTGLDVEGLPKRLTEAYADIVSARIRFRAEGTEGSEDLAMALSDMRRLAAAQEAFVALAPERENRNAAAFVAASAYQACLLGASSDERNSSYLDGSSVSSEVCASLLFLAADAHADAAECAKRITVPQERQEHVDGVLLRSIKLLAQGKLDDIRLLPVPALQEDESSERAIEALYLALYVGVKNLAARLLSRIDLPVDEGGIEPAATQFARVKGLSIGTLGDVLDTGNEAYNLFPGPLHLANLLLAVDRDLIATATSRTLPPDGVSEDAWWPVIRRMAMRRPYLWRNHKEAIASSYLDVGVSAAISFPTGAGKSTLAELKIATALLREKKVVFLVPTHALVDQTTRALKETFNTFQIFGDVDDETTALEIVELPEAIVTTPERCLMLLSSQPEAFGDLGLIVFDECHLLHPRDVEKSRRSIDAMLTVLNLAIAAPAADFLFLSAMMKNTEEIAAWLSDLTGRQCLHLDLAWKPTRQVRGCVVYPAKRIEELEAVLAAARLDRPTQKNVPAAVSRTLTAQPFGFFSLLQTWATQDRNDYTLLPLLSDEHHLSTGTNGRRWYLTPNGNRTSALVAASAATSGMKTLVFVQTVPLAESAARNFRDLLDLQPVVLTDEEKALYSFACEEMGGPDHCYLSLEEDGTFLGGAIGHHSLLLKEERLLHESMFKRSPGVDVLFATSTLAQGMNLPSEVVIISGDSRFDPNDNKLAQLEAHELLNAAGRAGRAGEGSQGFVLVVPSKVVSFDDTASLIGPHWMTLQTIFSQSDQCLEIDDPLVALLDAVHAGTRSGMPLYLLSRLPSPDENGTDAPMRGVLGRSFGAFRARSNGNAEWVESRIRTAFEARNEQPLDEKDRWLDTVAGLTGVSVQTLREISEVFGSDDVVTSTVAIDRLLAWLKAKPERLFEVLRPENVAEFFGGEYEKLETDAKRAVYALPIIAAFLAVWMSGQPLDQMEAHHPDPDVGRCKHARHFVLRLVPDLAFLAGLPARLMSAQMTGDEALQVPLTLSTLGGAVREGCESPDALAVRVDVGRSVSRVAARQRYELLRGYIKPAEPMETFEDALHRVSQASALLAFSTNI